MHHDNFPPTHLTQHTLSVSELNRKIRQLFDDQLPAVWVEGELSNLAIPHSGHWYFTLKDASAQVRCAFFKRHHPLGLLPPEAGSKILLKGRISLYENRGDYQLIVEKYQPAGAGLLNQAFEALKIKLEKAGLFAVHNKQSLPKMPQHLGIITSATGAALHDILTVLKRRFPLLPVTLFPSAVQGKEAAQQLVNAITRATQHQPACDVLIIGRGGGSQEDLWPFNEECVAYALAQCPIPTISAVGHETDISICDFVADIRAATPSAAAEIASNDQYELLGLIQRQQQQLIQHMQRMLSETYYRLDLARSRLKHPKAQINQQQYQLHTLHKQLSYVMNKQYDQRLTALRRWQGRLALCSPTHHLHSLQQRVDHLRNRLQKMAETQLSTQQQRLGIHSSRLHAMSPLATLSRGYALAQTQDGHILCDATHTKTGENLNITLHQGSLLCQVMKIQEQ